MKKRLVCCMAVLCVILSGCAGGQREDRNTEPPGQEEVQREVQNETAPSQTGEPDSQLEDDTFSGRWQAVETPQYYMDIAREDGGSYTLEIIWAGASRGNIVWQVFGNYDETWEGVAYVGAKYEDVVNEDGSIDRLPVPEREEVTGMVYLEEDGTLRWIDDFDHAGDGLSFERE